MWTGTVGPNDALYVPCGMVMAEKVPNSDTFGLRMGVVMRDTAYAESQPMIIKLTEDMTKLYMCEAAHRSQDREFLNGGFVHR